MADLDRAYVINGDDLRIALNSGPALVPNPRDMAEYILAKVAAPLGDEPGETGVHVCCEHVPGSLASGELDVMDKIAGLLRHRSERSRRRVLRWARDYLLDCDEPPF